MQISIIGLGWLGLPLAKRLSSQRHIIKGSTTSEEKLKTLDYDNISCFQVILKEGSIAGDIEKCLSGSDILILNTPPGLRRNPDSNYVAKIEALIPHIVQSSIQRVLYISSTSVFSDGYPFTDITNKTLPDATTNAGLQIRKVEELLYTNTSFDTTILRFSGLIANDRHPARMMSKRKDIPNGNAPVNLIHRNDCIGIIEAIIEQEKWNLSLNASYPDHPTKKEYYNKICKNLGYKLPDFSQGTLSNGKVIDGSYVESLLNYSYTHKIY